MTEVDSHNQNILSTVDDAELEHFKTFSTRWWSGKSGLKSMNEIRIPLIRDGLTLDNPYDAKPFQFRRILEVGCGGGILSEGLARLGGIIHAIDPGFDFIEIAKHHASLDPSLTNLTYAVDTIENHAITNFEKYDVVVASEVLEHVTEKELFLEACVKCLKPNGTIFVTTFNKTHRAWLINIVLIQEILNIIPRGTHTWNKFISPDDVTKMLQRYNCKTVAVKGIWFNFLSKKWSWWSSTSINYALQARKMQ